VFWQLLSLMSSTNTIHVMQPCQFTTLSSITHYLLHLGTWFSCLFVYYPARGAEPVCQICPCKGVCACTVLGSVTFQTACTACRTCVSNPSMSRCLCMHCLTFSDFTNPLHSMPCLLDLSMCRCSSMPYLRLDAAEQHSHSSVLLSNSVSEFAGEHRCISAEQ